jgi:DNA polymerase III subunit chi
MTEVAFYLIEVATVADSYSYLCRLLEKIYQKQHKIYVYLASLEEVQKLYDLLWTFSDISFVPHAIYTMSPDLAAPIQIGIANPPPECTDVLLNLTDTVPEFYKQFKKVIEIVPTFAPLKAKARERYKYYQAQNCKVVKHDVTSTNNSSNP